MYSTHAHHRIKPPSSQIKLDQSAQSPVVPPTFLRVILDNALLISGGSDSGDGKEGSGAALPCMASNTSES